MWRLLCAHWDAFRGTPARYWLESELAEIFEISLRPSVQTADAIYDQVAERLAKDDYRPRALYDQFRIQVLATTDDPADDLSAHAALAADPTFSGRVIPTFRPDRYLEPAQPGWREAIACLGEAADSTPGTTPASCARWRSGAGTSSPTAPSRQTTATSTSAPTRWSRPRRTGSTGPRWPARRPRRVGGAAPAPAAGDGPHVLRRRAGHDPAPGRPPRPPWAYDRGLRAGHRQRHPHPAEFTDALRPLLERYGTHPNLHLVVFTVDETAFSRELAPLAGFYPSLYVGVPWWFLDAPEAIRRFRAAVTETAGFSRTSGFVDDTRAFCSIPARHDMSRRIDAGWLARLVAEHRLDEDEATEAALDLVTGRPREVFKL